jgi:hypothetical protein
MRMIGKVGAPVCVTCRWFRRLALLALGLALVLWLAPYVG